MESTLPSFARLDSRGRLSLRVTWKVRMIWEGGFMGANYIASRPGDRLLQATAKRGGHSFDRKMEIASRREEISNTEFRCVASNIRRKKAGGFTSFSFAEFC